MMEKSSAAKQPRKKSTLWRAVCGYESQCYGARTALNWIFITVLLTVLSSLAISALETDAALAARKQNFQFLHEHIVRYNVTLNDAQVN